MTALYPLLKPPSDNYDSLVTLHNFHPFPLTFGLSPHRFVYLVYSDDKFWRSVLLDSIKPGHSYSIKYSDTRKYLIPDAASLFLALSTHHLPHYLYHLNQISTPRSLPAWRSTLSISQGQASTSLQGECPIFPSKRPLISFSPFIQGFGSDNFFYLVNLTDAPKFHISELNVYDPCKPKTPLVSYTVSTNSCNLIKLENDLSGYTSLVFHSPDITGVPIFLSSSQSNLSIEHTHPAASFTLGTANRNKLSKSVGLNWVRYISGT